MSFDLGALLEPLGVAIHASRRAQLIEGCSTLILGAGTVGLLCAAMAKVAGSTTVRVADIQNERVEFAVANGFGDDGYKVPRKHGQDTQEKLQIAKEIASMLGETRMTHDQDLGVFDVVFECTGVEACTQTAIYAARPGGKVVIVGMGNPVQTLPLSAAALREVDIIGTFRYANTYREAIKLVSSEEPLVPDLSRLVTHHFHGLESIPQAFEMAARAQDDPSNLVLKVVVETGEM